MFQMILTQREIMDKEVYNVPNVLGIDIECYPFKGSIVDNREREVPMNGDEWRWPHSLQCRGEH